MPTSGEKTACAFAGFALPTAIGRVTLVHEREKQGTVIGENMTSYSMSVGLVTTAPTAPNAGPFVGTIGLTLSTVKPDGARKRPLSTSRDIGVFANIADARAAELTPAGSGVDVVCGTVKDGG